MEQIKQEIINNIYENGENLITGPVLQTVLLDMVDDVNSKVASASVAPDIVDKTGSWDDAADWVEENSSSLVHENDLDGYATEQWVENQGYLKEHQDLGGYATTESLNDLSESVANDLANLPEPDLSDYATKEYVEATSASVKEWVENKHYLTTASLSGSVTEESVQFMINDATASVKTWVGDQNYATETFVSQAIAEIPGTDLTGYATEAWVEEQGYLTEHQDISGLATTQSVTSLSESVANDFANLDIPDVSGLATTESVTQLSESVAASIENLPEPDLSVYATTASVSEATESVKTWVQEQGYLTEHQDISGLATTESLNQLSESVAQTIENLPQADLSGYLQTSSYLVDSASFDSRIKDAREEATIAITNVSEGVVALSASFDQRINSITGSEADLSGYATTASVNSISQSISQSINTLAGSVADKANARDLTSLSSSVADDFANLEIPDVSGYATTQSVNNLSASFAETIDNIPGTDLTGYATEQWVQNQGYLTEHQDISGLATTSSVNQLSSSVSSDIQNARTEASQAITGLGTIVQGESDRVTGLSASFDDRINNITGSSVDLSGYATTQSVNALSASFDQRLLSASGLTYQDLNNLGLVYDTGEGNWSAKYIPEEGTGNFEEEAPAIWKLLRDRNLIGVEEDENGWRIAYTLDWKEWVDNPVGKFLDFISEGKLATLELPEGAEQDIWVSPIVREVEALSASFDQRINDLPGGEKIWVRGTGSGSAVLSGSRSTASGEGSVAEGELTKALGRTSHAEGYNTIASGNTSHAEGAATTASGSYSHAEGYYSTASGYCSHAEGRSTVASGNYSHAEGHRTVASGIYSHAEGSGSVASGTSSHAEGLFTTASGTGSHAEGLYTIVRNEYEVGIGKFNTRTDQNHRGRIFSLGVGTDDSNRKDAIVVYTGSVGPRILVYGVGGYDGTNPDSAKTLAQAISEITGSDLSGYATTESVNQISYSVDYRLDQLEQEKEIPFWSSGSGEYSVVRKNGSFAEALGEGSIFLGYGSGRIINANYYRCEYETWTPQPSDSNPKYYLSHEVNSSQWDRVEVGQNLVSDNDHLGKRVAQVVSKGQDTSGKTAGMYWITLSTYVGTPVWLMLVEVGSRIAGKGAIGGGCGTDTSNDYETGLGKYSRSGSGQIFSVGVGSSKTDRRNAISIVTGSNPSASVYIYGVGSYDGTNPQPGTNDLASVIASGGTSYSVETWTFILEDSSSVTKNVVVA